MWLNRINTDINYSGIGDNWVNGGVNGHHWGDYDNDGDLDFVIGGIDYGGGKHLKVFQNDNGTLIIEILKDDLFIDNNLQEYFSLMKYQIVPIILFTDNFENVKHIHVDSWNTNYNFKAVELNKNIGLKIKKIIKARFELF